MEKVVVDQLVRRISGLLLEKLDMKGRSLEIQVRRAGRILPSSVRRAAEILISAEQMACEPKMLLRLDPDQVSTAYEICLTHLESVNPQALKSKARFGFASAVIIQLVLVFGATVAVLRWRGFI